MNDASVPEPRPFDPSAPSREWLHPDEQRRLWHEQLPVPGMNILAWSYAGSIYRFYDAERRLLYVGQAEGDPKSRWAHHRRKASWWALIAFASVAYVTPVKSDRLLLEKAAIQAERPLYNKVHAARTASRSWFTVSTRHGPGAVVEQFREHLLPEDFAAIAEAFATALRSK